MDTITHFSHEHPLHLLKQKPTEAGKVCYACKVPLIKGKEHLVESYGCELCEEFFLHKYCAQLPMEIVHKSHKNHSLFLVLNLPRVYKVGYCKCQHKLCPSLFSRDFFFYYCYVCDFILETKCAFREKDSVVLCKKELIFHHSSHKHQLMVQPKPASFWCDACGVKNEDLSYHCTPCHYRIHKRCAMLPITTLKAIHSHPLTLSFGLPSQYFNKKNFRCDICEEVVRGKGEYWLYYCESCRYFVLIRCMDKKKKQIEVDLNGIVIDDLLCLPTNEKSVELIQRCLVKNKNPCSNPPEIQVSGHKHPLLYSNGPFPEDFIEDGEEIMCDACIDPIFSPPYYHCAECRYFLHLSCAKLPQQLQHPNHPHELILVSKTRFHEMFRCNRCNTDSNGFFYYCRIDGCEFYLDLKCVALPNVIIHENHNHPLVHKTSEFKFPSCRGCGDSVYWKSWIGCYGPCVYDLHIKCVLLPKTIKNRYDSKHPLTLRYPPIPIIQSPLIVMNVKLKSIPTIGYITARNVICPFMFIASTLLHRTDTISSWDRKSKSVAINILLNMFMCLQWNHPYVTIVNNRLQGTAFILVLNAKLVISVYANHVMI